MALMKSSTSTAKIANSCAAFHASRFRDPFLNKSVRGAATVAYTTAQRVGNNLQVLETNVVAFWFSGRSINNLLNLICQCPAMYPTLFRLE